MLILNKQISNIGDIMNIQKMFGCMVCLLVGILMFSACQNEDYEMVEGKNEGDMVYFGLNLPSMDEIVVSRAAANDIEKYVYTIYALAFDSNEKCFYKEEIYNGYAEKKPYSSSQALGIPKQTGTEYEHCTVWLIANVGAETGVAAGAYDFSKVTTLEELKATYAYRLLQGSSSGDLIQRDCIPMTGTLKDVNMTSPTSISTPYSVTMERILAKVSFTVKVTKPDLEFYFNNWTVESLPRYTYVIPRNNPEQDMDTKPEEDLYEAYFPSNDNEKNLVTYGVGGQWIQQDSPSKTYGFYMYENRKGGRLDYPNADNLYGEAGDYAEDIKNNVDTENSPKFKTLYAPDNASFIVLTGLIRDKNTKNVTSFAYKIALGANNSDDYNIRRDHNYVYNINIGGVAYDDITVDAFDSRVHKAYALQVSAPYSEQIDAHYDKRYLDILASPGELELQFYPTQKDAEDGTNAMSNDDWIVLSEMDTYNIDIDPNEGTSKTYTFADTEHKEYFVYTQENLSTASRSAVLKLKHTPEKGSSEVVQQPVTRYYTFTQAGLIEVNGVYVESYEEYGMNLDPYNSKDQAVQGLQWGWGIVKSGNTVTTAYDFTQAENSALSTTDGHTNTLNIVSMENIESGNPIEAFPGADTESLYNNYAARYCYNKNKRNAKGEIIEYNWYLPASEQLKSLTAQVPGMTTNNYWSSTVPAESDVNARPDWVTQLGGLVEAIWDWIFNSRLTAGSENEYRNVSISVANGNIDLIRELAYTVPLVGTKYYVTYYPPRTTTKSVRAVRIKPNN